MPRRDRRCRGGGSAVLGSYDRPHPPCGPPRSPPPPLTSPGGSGGGGRALDRRSGGGTNVALCVACLADERRQALDVAGGGSAPDQIGRASCRERVRLYV